MNVVDKIDMFAELDYVELIFSNCFVSKCICVFKKQRTQLDVVWVQLNLIVGKFIEPDFYKIRFLIIILGNFFILVIKLKRPMP